MPTMWGHHHSYAQSASDLCSYYIEAAATADSTHLAVAQFSKRPRLGTVVMSSKGRVTTYGIRTSPSRKTSSSSSYSSTKDRHRSRSHVYTLHQNSSRDSVSSTSRQPQSDEDVVIVVMGMAGSGKSTFINLLADEKVKVGHSLQSCTSEVQVASFSTRFGRPGYLIDTPGFDDTNRCDTEILKEIAAFLTKRTCARFT